MSPAEIAGGTVLVGIADGDDPARALAWAVEAARLERRHLTVARVAGAGSEQDGAVTRAVAWARRSAPGLDVTGAWLHGDPEEVLAELSTQAHLLVLGADDGPGPLAAAVTRRAACPVVLCPATAPAPGAAVLVGADGSVESQPVLELAFQQAALRDVALQVALCATEPSDRSWPGGQPPTDRTELRLQLARSVAELAEKFAEVPILLRLDSDDLTDALTVGQRWALVVMERPTRAPVRPAGPDLTSAALEAAASPVVVVPEVLAEQRRGPQPTLEEPS